MDSSPKLTITWEYVVHLARQLEAAAYRNSVAPEDGARLVRLVLQFNDNITHGMRPTTPSTPPPSNTG